MLENAPALLDDPHRGRAEAVEALAHLGVITRRLRDECPWDREQTARTIVPHTVEEAYEVADAGAGGKVAIVWPS